MTMSLISDELWQASTKKKEFLGIMEKLIPWSQWVGIVQPHYYKGERGNKPYEIDAPNLCAAAPLQPRG